MVMEVTFKPASRFGLRTLDESSDVHDHLGLGDNSPSIWPHHAGAPNVFHLGVPLSPLFEGAEAYGRFVRSPSFTETHRPSGVSMTVSNWNELSVAIPSEERLLEPQAVLQAALPQVEWIIRRHPLLTPAVVSLLQPLRSVVLSKALQAGLDVARLGVDVEEDPEEKAGQAVFRVYVRASAVQTLAFWDSLDIEMGRWLERLTHRDRRTLLENVGLRFHWTAR
jgi:hypothetical protein